MNEAQEVLFRPFRLDMANEQLWRGSQPITLRPKTFGVLRCLVERAGRLVSKEELLDTVWPDTTVSDVVPIVCVRELRKALGDDAEAPRFIETLVRRGYRFIAPLTSAQPVVSSQYSGVSRQKEAGDWGLGARPSSLQAPSPKSLAPNLVGRETELTKLHSLLSHAFSGERQFVFISGESGIGKTTLVDVFLDGGENWQLGSNSVPQQVPPAKLHLQAPSVWIGRGQCIEQHGAGEAYLPLLDVIGRLCSAPGGQEWIALLRRYAPTWLMQFPSLLNAPDIEELQRKIHGATQERMLREIAEAMEAATMSHPVVLVLEDLQWSDASTLDFLAFLAHRRGPARLFVVGTYRPAELTGGPHSLATLTQELCQHHLGTEMALSLLNESEVATYLKRHFPSELCDRAPLHEWAHRLHQRTDGNPLFLTNVVEYVIARDIDVTGGHLFPAMEQMLDVVPQSLQQLIEQQLDRLSLEDQHLLEVASVAGVEFSAAAVAAGLERDVVAVEERCRELARHRQFLQTRGVEEWPDETVATRFGFIHSLYQQVLYQRVTEAQKARLHVRIGTCIETGYHTQTKDVAAVLAMHFRNGRDYRRAVYYLHQAAENAVWRCAFQEANAHFTKGIELLHHWPDTPERTQQEILLHLTVLGPLLTLKGEASAEVEHFYAQIVRLHQHLGATEPSFLVLLGLWVVRLVRGELVEARTFAEQMVTRSETEADAVMRLWAHLAVGIGAYYRGEFTTAHAYCEEVTTLCDTQQPQHLLDPKMLALSFDALCMWMLGQPQRARQRSQEALSWAHGSDHPYNRVAAQLMASWLHVLLRDGATAEAEVDVALPAARAHGFVQYIALGTLLRGSALIEQRQSSDGLHLISQGFEALHTVKVRLGLPFWQGLRATALGSLGRTNEALAVIAEAEATMEQDGERFFAAELYRIKGELLVRQCGVRSLKCEVKKDLESSVQSLISDPPSTQHPAPNTQAKAEAEAYLRQAIAIARQQHAKALELRAVMSLVRVRQQCVLDSGLRVTDDDSRAALSEAHTMLAELCDWFDGDEETVDVREARGLLAELEERSRT